MTEQLLVLEIGGGPKPQAKPIWPDAVMETMDADEKYNPTYLHNAVTMPDELANRYDHVLASHVLEHFPWFMTDKVLLEWKKVVKPGGYLHVIVPSLEWAAKQILSEHPSKAIYPHMKAGQTTQYDYHLSGFMMRSLRSIFDIVGMAVVRARSGAYTIKVVGELMEAEQHYICGQKKVSDDNISRSDA